MNSPTFLWEEETNPLSGLGGKEKIKLCSNSSPSLLFPSLLPLLPPPPAPLLPPLAILEVEKQRVGGD